VEYVYLAFISRMVAPSVSACDLSRVGFSIFQNLLNSSHMAQSTPLLIQQTNIQGPFFPVLKSGIVIIYNFYSFLCHIVLTL
jgi:hypothetical protein